MTQETENTAPAAPEPAVSDAIQADAPAQVSTAVEEPSAQPAVIVESENTKKAVEFLRGFLNAPDKFPISGNFRQAIEGVIPEIEAV
jgi:hypothetical protein